MIIKYMIKHYFKFLFHSIYIKYILNNFFSIVLVS